MVIVNGWRTWTAALVLLAGWTVGAVGTAWAQATGGDTPEVVLEAKSQGFYRPTLMLRTKKDSSLAGPSVQTADAFAKHLHYALEWSGYVALTTPADTALVGPREIPADQQPGIVLTDHLRPDSVQVHATLTLSEPGGEPFYAGGISFDLKGATYSAEGAAEEILRQITGMTPPFRARIVAVERKPGNVKELVLLNFDGSREWPLTHDNSIALSPSWSPDGRRIVFSSFRGHRDADLYIADLDQRKIHRLLRRDGTDAAPSWSPDGKWIIFAGSSGSSTHLYLIRPDGTGLRRLTSGPSIDTSPSWAPTGREIVFMSDRSGSPQIYRMDREGANLRRLTYEGSYNADPAWSPAGDRIAYVRQEPMGFQVRSMDPTGDVDVPLTDEPGDHLDPSWSPDGMKITYNYRNKVWVMSADGTLRRPLLADGLMPSWSPIPNR